MRRTQEALVRTDIEKKVVFLVGPRQVGKTWLAREIARSFARPVYLSYDRREDRKIIEDESWLDSTDLLVLDELHKMPRWKTYLKGVYDTAREGLRLIVTGSARFDTFRTGGDSLAGRYFAHRLLPFSLSELEGTEHAGQIDRLIERGGFPEPFLADADVDADRWRLQYVDGLIRTDILDFERIHDLRAVQLVLELLRERVGSPVSYASIAGDVGVAPNTVKKYVQVLEALYIVFRVVPHARDIARSLRKEPKIYFFDTGLVKGAAGARFENFVGVSLLKHAYGRTDATGKRHELCYLRTKEGREVDFCLVVEGQPALMVEAKHADGHLAPALSRFHQLYGIQGVQLVRQLKREHKEQGLEVRSALSFLREL